MFSYKLYTEFAGLLRSNRTLFRWVFGFSPAKAAWGQYWDWTTITLCGSLKQILKPEMELLDMGCGPYAVLSRFAQNKLSCGSVTAADHCLELIEFARLNDPETTVSYLCSDLFSNVTGRFSVMVFNAPYIETDKGNRNGLFYDELAQKRFCGGKDGADTIQRFLQDLPGYLKPCGKVLLGVNHYHIRKAVVQAAIHKAGFKTVSIRYNPFTKACVYVLMEKEYA